MMKKLFLTLSLSLTVVPVYADALGPTEGTDLPPARITPSKPVAAPVEAAPVAPAVTAPAPRAMPVAEAAPAVRAGVTGWYAGVGGGWSSFNGNAVDLEPSLAGETYTLNGLDDDSTGWKVFGGYQFSKNLAVELAYTKLGKFSFDATVTGSGGSGGPYPVDEYGEVKPECWSLSAVGILPVGNNFSLLGKAGICRWDDNAYAYEGTYVYPERSTGTDLTFGLGAKYDATQNLGVRAEWERFNNVVHDRESVDLFSVSLQYNF